VVLSITKPLFITFEGIEGSGKSTQAKKLSQFLMQNNIANILTFEPGGSNIGNAIRNILLDKNNHNLHLNTEILLHLASRNQHLQEVIYPSLIAGKTVICDRFHDSTIAYQSFAMGGNIEIINNIATIIFNLNSQNINNCQKFQPDITFLFDLEVERAFNRIKNRSDNNRYEELGFNFHQKVRNGFLEIAYSNKKRIVIIDANQEPDLIFQEIINKINNCQNIN
jgi:dTMP kinase